jgi:S-formylglutathione hydrolase FrmB
MSDRAGYGLAMGTGSRLRRTILRRRIIAAAAVAVLLGVGVSQALTLLPGAVGTGSPAAHGATIVRYDLRSRFAHRTLPQVGVIPRGATAGAPRPLLVFLHGRGPHGEESNANGEFLHALDRLGARAPIVIFPSGAVSSYFHKRASGDWGRYVLDEVIPQAVARLHADPSRVAIGGISMGGFGAYDIARLRPGAFCAVGGHSAALWVNGGDSAAGAFDDAGDFARNDVIALARSRGRAAWGTARLWLDGGSADPFRPGGEALAAALHITMRHWPGEHKSEYWRAHYGSYLRFYAGALATCRAG